MSMCQIGVCTKDATHEVTLHPETIHDDPELVHMCGEHQHTYTAAGLVIISKELWRMA